jgi:hypothetical protein
MDGLPVVLNCCNIRLMAVDFYTLNMGMSTQKLLKRFILLSPSPPPRLSLELCDKSAARKQTTSGSLTASRCLIFLDNTVCVLPTKATRYDLFKMY